MLTRLRAITTALGENGSADPRDLGLYHSRSPGLSAPRSRQGTNGLQTDRQPRVTLDSPSRRPTSTRRGCPGRRIITTADGGCTNTERPVLRSALVAPVAAAQLVTCTPPARLPSAPTRAKRTLIRAVGGALIAALLLVSTASAAGELGIWWSTYPDQRHAIGEPELPEPCSELLGGGRRPRVLQDLRGSHWRSERQLGEDHHRSARWDIRADRHGCVS